MKEKHPALVKVGESLRRQQLSANGSASCPFSASK